MYKRALCFFGLLLCAVIVLCACDKEEVPATSIDASATADIIEYTKSHMGLILSVYVPEKVAHGEKFPVVARITNGSDKSITYTRSATGENMHFEIETVIMGSDSKKFIDCDTIGKPFLDVASGGTLKPGKSFEQHMIFLPGWTEDWSAPLNQAKITMLERGTYTGSADFRWDTDSGTESVSLKFPITVY